MPNWVKNSLRITGKNEVVARLLDAVTEGDNPFSLNKIVPMPDFIFRGGLSTEDRANNPNRNWYDWSCNFWGCKWNTDKESVTVTTSDDGAEIEFETPWNRPRPAITALSFMFPELQFVHKYANEDIGYDVGVDMYSGGKLIKLDMFPEGSETAKRFACDMWEYDYDEYIAEQAEG